MRIPLARGDGTRHRHAPFLDAELLLGSQPHGINFLVDTGAHDTLIPGRSLLDALERVWALGRDDVATGIGGDWPAKRFKSAEIRHYAGFDRAAKIFVPTLMVLAPYAEDGQPILRLPQGVTLENLKTRKPKWKVCRASALLGLDALQANGLSLHWHPRGGDSYLDDSAPHDGRRAAERSARALPGTAHIALRSA